MVKAVIFDIDGTLVDSVDLHAQSWVKALAHFGYEVEFEEMKQHIGKGGDLILQEFLSEADFKAKGSEISDYRERYFHENCVEQVKPFPRVRELFERLKENGIAIVLATSAETDLAQRYGEMLDVTDLIEGMTCAGDVEQAKPSPEVFEVALQQFSEQFPPQEIIVVGDSPYDAEAAGKIELSIIGLRSGDFAEAVLRDAGCVEVYQDIAELLNEYNRSPFVAQINLTEA